MLEKYLKAFALVACNLLVTVISRSVGICVLSAEPGFTPDFAQACPHLLEGFTFPFLLSPSSLSFKVRFEHPLLIRLSSFTENAQLRSTLFFVEFLKEFL